MSGKMNNEPTPANEPLTDEQLNQLFKIARPNPPARFESEFWNDLESKLEQPARPSAEVAVGGIRWLKQPWAAAAAALVVILVALPFTRNLSKQQDQANMTAQVPSSSMADNTSAEKLGASPPTASPAAKASVAPSKPAAAAVQQPTAATAGRSQGYYHPPQKTVKAPEIDDQISKPTESMDKVAKNTVLKEEAKQDQVHAKKPHKAAALDTMGTQLSNLVQDLDGNVRQIKPGSYEIRVPAAHRDELNSRVEQHSEFLKKSEKNQKDRDQDQVVYRVEINH